MATLLMENILEVRGLKTYFYLPDGLLQAVGGVSFTIPRGKAFGLVGESGCGKSTIGYSILRLVPPPGRIVEGEIIFDGKDILQLSESEMRKLRGRSISMIFQEPISSLNPVYTIGDQIADIIQLHFKHDRKEAHEMGIEMLKTVGISDPVRVSKSYPHELSGGIAQRALIAMALACRPKLLIADEPTTALDVTLQAQILDLLRELQEKFKLSLLLISHDLGVIAQVADIVAVMYAGQIVEYNTVEEIFCNPKHPYTQGLLSSIPGSAKSIGQYRKRLSAIKGSVPDLMNLPAGCTFAPRCPWRMEECSKEIPNIHLSNSQYFVKCIKYR